ncbi:hypothetical protein OOK31_35990 [Streptomyces sp. NBC_00249]|nr:hypothetical protein [Streptomyces sp. NBC_00249]MCX5199224.1 hypothetical protein [Streptomyces sp. NBC_00249]
MTVVEPRRTGTLRVPSGLLAVSGPDDLLCPDDDPRLFGEDEVFGFDTD